MKLAGLDDLAGLRFLPLPAADTEFDFNDGSGSRALPQWSYVVGDVSLTPSLASDASVSVGMRSGSTHLIKQGKAALTTPVLRFPIGMLIPPGMVPRVANNEDPQALNALSMRQIPMAMPTLERRYLARRHSVPAGLRTSGLASVGTPSSGRNTTDRLKIVYVTISYAPSTTAVCDYKINDPAFGGLTTLATGSISEDTVRFPFAFVLPARAAWEVGLTQATVIAVIEQSF